MQVASLLSKANTVSRKEIIKEILIRKKEYFSQGKYFQIDLYMYVYLYLYYKTFFPHFNRWDTWKLCSSRFVYRASSKNNR